MTVIITSNIKEAFKYMEQRHVITCSYVFLLADIGNVDQRQKMACQLTQLTSENIVPRAG